MTPLPLSASKRTPIAVSGADQPGLLPNKILQAVGLRKEFRGFVAVDDVNLSVTQGEIHALIGPNGAGKTTCFNLLTRFLRPTAGKIFFRGEDVTSERPVRLASNGMVRSFQISSVFQQLTVLENVRVALQRKSPVNYCFWKSRAALSFLNSRADDLLQEVGLVHLASFKAGDLAYGQKRALEIATTLALEPELILLDEPTQGMGREDVSRVTELIKRVSRGKTILMVEHNMSVVSKIADRITVLSRGQVLAEGTYAAISTNPRVVEAYMGAQSARGGEAP